MTSHKEKSALNVMGGVEQPRPINTELVGKLKGRKAGTLSTSEIMEGIRAGNRTVLSRAITLVESSLPAHREKAQEIISECLKVHHPASSIHHPASSIRIGITGVPGVGKSTFIEAFGKYLTSLGHKVAVLAIDPSSSRSKGSILGDKTRMEELASDPDAYIRPSPSAGSLGGVARKTRETIILCEAAGFDIVIVETVGVGQSETAVHGMVDFFLLLMLAGAGDELQGIKRGIIEMADAIFINKADGDNVKKASASAAEYASALRLFPPSASSWTPLTGTCSARTRSGIAEVWDTICSYRSITADNGFFQAKRREQSQMVLSEALDEGLKGHFRQRKDLMQMLHNFDREIQEGRMNPYSAAQALLDAYFGKDKLGG